MEITNAMATKNTYKPIEKLFIVKWNRQFRNHKIIVKKNIKRKNS
jgi:hypothetical protein